VRVYSQRYQAYDSHTKKMKYSISARNRKSASWNHSILFNK